MWWSVGALIFGLWAIFTNFRYNWLYIIAKTFRRDIEGIRILLGSRSALKNIKKKNLNMHKQFMKVLERYPNKIAFYFEDQSWTYAELNDFSNKIGRIFSEEGYQKGDVIAIYYENRIEYVGIWLGLTKIGVISALVNTNLPKDALLHSLTVSKAKALIFGTSFLANVEELSPQMGLYQMDDSITAPTSNLTQKVAQCDSANLEVLQNINHDDPVQYMFTSGTTGLPKAAIVSHERLLGTAAMMMLKCNLNDVVYDPLPLYHMTPFLGVQLSVCYGLSCVIRKRFSPSNYFTEATKYNCTMSMYVGEVCRYIINVSSNGNHNHSVKKMFGNGLRKEVWIDLVKKFGVQHIYEYYGATEGNVVLFNMDNTAGSIGFIPRYLRKIYKVQIVKYDEDEEKPVRDGNGRCIRCDLNEPGLVIGKIDGNLLSKYRGYTDQAQSRSKILRDVFKQGDMYFNTGDLMVMDELGYVYFKDRTGDTFRWKSENVSTMEVEVVLSKMLNHSDVVVFGVAVPSHEGKAGMAVICDRGNSIELLSEGVTNNLASYAIPLFLRVTAVIPTTGNFRLKKTDLQSEGFDIHRIDDPLYLFSSKLKKYVPLTDTLYNDVINNKIRL